MLSRLLPGGTENNHEGTQSKQAVSRPRFELGTFRVRGRSANRSTATYGQDSAAWSWESVLKWTALSIAWCSLLIAFLVRATEMLANHTALTCRINMGFFRGSWKTVDKEFWHLSLMRLDRVWNIWWSLNFTFWRVGFLKQKSFSSKNSASQYSATLRAWKKRRCRWMSISGRTGSALEPVFVGFSF
jgi:hypothetical protein